MATDEKNLNQLGHGMIFAYDMHNSARCSVSSCKKALAELEKVARGAPIAERKAAVRKQLKKAEIEVGIWKRSYDKADAALRQAQASERARVTVKRR